MFKTVQLSQLFLLLFLGGYLGKASLVKAQLPPPPPIPEANNSLNSSHQPSSIIPLVEQRTNPVFREYNFQAPQPEPGSFSGRNNVIAPPNPTDKQIAFYRVQVIANDISILSVVKKVEPLANFQPQQGVIYAGLFTQQQQAQQRVQKLAAQGLSAQIVPVNYSVSQSYNLPVQR
jgi:hypothetical protein